MLERVLIAARGDGDAVRRRVDQLAHWYGLRAEVRAVAGGTVTVASLGGPLHAAAFGEAPPATLDVLGADERALRRYEGGGAALAATADRARIVAGAGAPASLYAAASGGVSAWATHAVAAAYTASGSAAVDASALPEQLAAGFVGGARSLVAGVRALSAASFVDFSATRADEGCYWPARDRWRLVPEEDAYAYTEHHLLRSLEARLAGVDRALAGLTGGAGSRAAALALRELGVAFEGFTIGAPDDEDVEDGAEAARALAVSHRRLAVEDLDGAAALARVRAAARFTEGAVHVGFAGIPWPDDASAFVTGAGGEAGRCFYYRHLIGAGAARGDGAASPLADVAGGDRRPAAPPADLGAVVFERLANRIAGAEPESLAGLEMRVREWVARAEELGVAGWRVLDVVCAEQRVRRRLHGLLPPVAAPAVGALTAPEVQRGLVSLALGERVSDGFARRFVADRMPDLVPASARRPVAGRRPLSRIARRAAGGGPLAVPWTAAPEFREWVADAVLGGPLAAEAMGERWCRRTRSRFYAGDATATDRALWLAGPVALQEAVATLPRG